MAEIRGALGDPSYSCLFKKVRDRHVKKVRDRHSYSCLFTVWGLGFRVFSLVLIPVGVSSACLKP